MSRHKNHAFFYEKTQFSPHFHRNSRFLQKLQAYGDARHAYYGRGMPSLPYFACNAHTRPAAHAEKSAFCAKITFFVLFTREIGAAFFSTHTAILAYSGQSACGSCMGPQHAVGRFLRLATLGRRFLSKNTPKMAKISHFRGVAQNRKNRPPYYTSIFAKLRF